MGTVLVLLIGFVIAGLITGFVIWVVSRLNLGLSVTGFGAAFIAAIVIAVVSFVVTWLLSLVGITVGGGILGAIVSLVIAAVVLMISDRFVPGMSVSGFSGAIVAAIAIAVVTWLVQWVLGLLGLG